MRYLPPADRTETIPRTQNPHLASLHHCHQLSSSPEHPGLHFTAAQSADTKKNTGKGRGESRQRVLQKKFQPISKGTPNFRKPTLTFQQPLCVIRQFHVVLTAAQQNTLISSALRAGGLPEDVHRSVQRPMPFVPMGRQCPKGRSWGQKQWRGGVWHESAQKCKPKVRSCAGSTWESAVGGKILFCFSKLPAPLWLRSLVWAQVLK